MRSLLLLFLIVFGCRLQAQKTKQPEPMVTIPGLQDPIPLKNYNSAFAGRKISNGTGMIRIGAVFTGISVVMITTGCILLNKNAHGPNYFPLLVLGAVAFPPSVIVVGAGIFKKHRWRIVQKNLQLHSGILSNGHVGLALNF